MLKYVGKLIQKICRFLLYLFRVSIERLTKRTKECTVFSSDY